ncbi:MAG: LemA protein [Actinomycetota bacterium]|jgi:LemA protein|nr:LemA protein [Actinomycetota bacterium]
MAQGIGFILVMLVLLMPVLSYNRFVTQRQLIQSAWASIDADLQRRYDLIPNLVETVKGYAGHERATLQAVADTRARAMAATGNPAQRAVAEAPLQGALGRLLAVAEAYPDLKADRSFLELQHELTSTEDRIQASRRFYNGRVQELNRRVQAFPSSLIAHQFGFKAAEFFELDPATRSEVEAPPTIDLGDGGVSPSP